MATQRGDEATEGIKDILTESDNETRDMADGYAERLIEAGLLPEREAQVLVLRDGLGMCREYTADRLGISSSRVDNALRSARQRLDTARATLPIVGELSEEQYPEQLDTVDNTHADGFDVESIQAVIASLTETVENTVESDLPNSNSEEYATALRAAVWMQIKDKSQRELYETLEECDHEDSDEAAELLDPSWRPMSEKAFTATRDYFSGDGEAVDD